MAWLSKCAKPQDDAGSSDWSDMFIFYCLMSAAEDRKFARQINMLRCELSVACQEMGYLIQKLETVKRVITPMKMTEFLNQVKLKDDQRLAQLENLKRETKLRAFEKELFVQKYGFFMVVSLKSSLFVVFVGSSGLVYDPSPESFVIEYGLLSVAISVLSKVFCYRMSGGGGVVIGLAMVVEMVETQHLAFLTTSLQSGRKVCAYGLKQVMVATAVSSSMIALKQHLP
ncbi:hypothetical protein Tco_1443534 [Tanacetum coccineum]